MEGLLPSTRKHYTGHIGVVGFTVEQYCGVIKLLEWAHKLESGRCRDVRSHSHQTGLIGEI